MNRGLTLVCLILFIPLVGAETQISLDASSADDIFIAEITEFVQINGLDVEVEYFIELGANSFENWSYNPNLRFHFTKGQDRFFNPFIKDVKICLEGVDSEHNYGGIGMECNESIGYNFSKEGDWGYTYEIQKEDINLVGSSYTPIYFRIRMTYPNFTIERPDIKIFWNILKVQPEPRRITKRYLLTENDAMIEGLLNYSLIRYDTERERFILGHQGLGETQVLYKSYSEERKNRLFRDFSLVILTMGISILLSTFFHFDREEKRNKKVTLLIFMSLGLALTISGVFLLFELNRTSLFFLISSLIFLFLWAWSRKQDG